MIRVVIAALLGLLTIAQARAQDIKSTGGPSCAMPSTCAAIYLGSGTATSSAPVTISTDASDAALQSSLPLGTVVQETACTSQVVHLMDAYGSAKVPIYAARRSEGTATSPSAVGATDILAALDGSGFDGSAYSGILLTSAHFSQNSGYIDLSATSNWSTSNHGSSWGFAVTPDGTIASGVVFTLNGLTGATEVANHLASTGPAAGAVSSCGTGSPAVNASATDTRGSVTTGSSATACTVAFSSGGFHTTPFCTASTNVTTAFAAVTSVSTSSITFGLSASSSGIVITWTCLQ